MARKRRALSKNKIRNLQQYQNLSDEEFEEIWIDKFLNRADEDTEKVPDLEVRINSKLAEFEEDYDLSDLKVNDKVVLRNLIQAMIQLEDLETEMYDLRQDGISMGNMTLIESTNRVMATLRSNISSMQQDLNITRKIRKGDKEVSVLIYLDDLKAKAKKFYESKMTYIWCPKCKMLLSTIWVMYPREKGNKLQLVCNRVLENGEKCGHKFTVDLKDIIENRGINSNEVPEFFK